MADYAWISERLAVGGKIESLADVRTLKARGITHILNLRETNEDERPWCQQVGVEYFHNGAHNDDGAKALEWFAQSISYAWRVLIQPKARLLIHCKKGESRSPSTAYAVLRSFGVPAMDAEEHVIEGRPEAGPTITFKADADKAIRWLGFSD